MNNLRPCQFKSPPGILFLQLLEWLLVHLELLVYQQHSQNYINWRMTWIWTMWLEKQVVVPAEVSMGALSSGIVETTLFPVEQSKYFLLFSINQSFNHSWESFNHSIDCGREVLARNPHCHLRGVKQCEKCKQYRRNDSMCGNQSSHEGRDLNTVFLFSFLFIGTDSRDSRGAN